LNYKPLFKIEFLHSFFRENKCLCLSVNPVAKTERLLRKSNIIIRRNYNQVHYLYNHNELDKIKAILEDEENKFLWLRIFSIDKYFRNYTNLDTNNNTKIIFSVLPDELNNENILEVKKANYKNINDELFSDILDKKDKLIRPIAVLKMNIKDIFEQILQKSTPVNIYISFEARKTYWTYFIILKNVSSERKIKIVDIKGEVNFSEAEKVTLIDGKEAVKIVSEKSVELQEYSEKHFQLVVNGMVDERIFEKRLPVAGVSQIFPETKNGEEKIYSDIFYYN